MTRDSLLPNGTAVGRFLVEQRIGAGGMGVVYAARDTVLGRKVALKIVPQSLATDRDRVERFLREARAASSLNHPAIVTIYDSGIADGVPYLAMELIEGETLAQWTRGGRNHNKVPEVLAQIADGLARAHTSGIVHRDLKPDNIMIARGGFAKILDFGIAKLIDRHPAAKSAETAPAAMLGTAAFMSPEQVEGRPVDHRSDIFSLGCVMHAAFEGRAPFERDSAVATMNAVVNDPAPDLNAPLHLKRIARRCLAKDPDERYQSIRDVALDLRDAPLAIEPRTRTRPMWLAAPLVLSGIVGIGMWVVGARSVEVPQVTMQRVTNSGKTITGAISPDGKYVVHATLDGDTQTVWVRQIATGTDVRIIPPADGFYSYMQVSPDGNYAFYSYAPRSNPNVQDVFQIPILGGESRRVASDIDGCFAVSPDGHRLAFRRFNAVDRVDKLFVKELDSGAENVVMKERFPKFIGAAPTWSPDSQHLTIVTGVMNDSNRMPAIAQLDIASGHLEPINIPPWPFIGEIAWLPDGSGIVLSASERQEPPQLWFVPANGKPPHKITSDIAMYGGVSVTSDSKTLAAHRAENSVNLWLVPFDHPEQAHALTTGLGNFFGTGGVRWISDREFIYTVFGSSASPSIKALHLDRNESREIAKGPFWNLAVSRDRSRLAFTSDRSGKIEVWSSRVDGSDMREVTRGAAGGSSISFFPDNETLAYVSFGREQAVWRSAVAGGGQPVRLTDRPANAPQISPDGRSLLCRLRSVQNGAAFWQTAILRIGSSDSPRYFPIPRAGGPHAFQWLSNGASFAFIDWANGVQNIWIQDVAGGPPRPLTRFDAGRIAAYDISPDGRSIVVARSDPVNDVVLIRGFR